MRPELLLFDLDGTLTQSAPGITRSVAFALGAVGLPPLDDATLLRFVGPPLVESFRDIAGLDPAGVAAAIRAYREYFVDRGMFENSVYARIPALLRALADDGRRMMIATSKPMRFATPIVEHFGLARFFEAVHGPEADDLRAVKAEIVRTAIATLQGRDGADAVLVGDRSHDVVGAHAVGIPCVGVLWGYGSRDELSSAGADAIVADVEELARLLDVPLSPVEAEMPPSAGAIHAV